jgi:hypothetical protein
MPIRCLYYPPSKAPLLLKHGVGLCRSRTPSGPLRLEFI